MDLPARVGKCIFSIKSNKSTTREKLTKFNKHSQSVPIVEKIGEKINNAADFAAALERARQLTPDGGTCPSATLERSLGQMMANDLPLRPYKVGVLITDGVFYDMPKPEIAFKGLHYCKFLNNFSLKSKNNKGN